MAGVEESIKSSLNSIKSMVEKGKTDKEIANNLGISYASYKNYKAKNLALKAIYDEIKDNRVIEVENKLFKLCCGYKYSEEMAFKCKEEFKEGDQVLVKEVVKVINVTKYKGPDLAAQKYYLNNKDKKKWSEDPNRVDANKKALKLKAKQIEKEEF